MLKLIIDKKCVDCGNCEAWMPGLMQHSHRGYLLINEKNPCIDDEAIQNAIDCCPLDALVLREV